jgi:hypothetical protein
VSVLASDQGNSSSIPALSYFFSRKSRKIIILLHMAFFEHRRPFDLENRVKVKVNDLENSKRHSPVTS